MVTKFEKEICEILISKYESRYNNGSDFGRKISLKFDENGYKKYVVEDAYKYREAIDEAVEHWLELLFETNGITETVFKDFQQKAGALRRMLISSINTAKENM